jgi:hypothetical protein
MTKKQMIQIIQNAEATAYLAIKQSHQTYGVDSILTRMERRTFGTIVELMKELKLKPDYTHPANQEGLKLMLEIDAAEAASTLDRI